MVSNKDKNNYSDNGKMPLTVWGYIKVIAMVISVVGAIIGALYGIDSYVDHKIQNKMNDDTFVNRIASQVRPYLIFDLTGSILIDAGGMNYIESIKVLPPEKAGPFGEIPNKIIVTPKKYSVHPPLLSILTMGLCSYKVERGEGITFVYSITFEALEEHSKVKDIKFRLEILKNP